MSATAPIAASADDSPRTVADAMYALGYDLIARDRLRDATDVFRAMLLVCPTDERSWLGLGRCHERMGQSDVARELYGLFVHLSPDAVRARIALGQVLRVSDREDDAEAVLEEAEQIAASAKDDELLLLVRRARASS